MLGQQLLDESDKILNSSTAAFIQAIKDRNNFNLQETFDKGGVNLDYKDSQGKTLTHMAASDAYMPFQILSKLVYLGCPLDNTVIELCPCEKRKEHLRNLLSEKEQKQIQMHIEDVTRRIEEEIQQQRIHPGIYFRHNLDLLYLSKKAQKTCPIPDKWEELDQKDKQKISLHKRLAMIEAFTVSNTDDPNKLQSISYTESSSRNYVTANLGFVVSNKVHSFHKDDGYKRVFITIPVDDAYYAVYKGNSTPIGEKNEFGHYSQWDNPHSEITLYRYLKNINTIRKIILELTCKLKDLKYEYPSYPREGDHLYFNKVYAIIIDIHTSRDMCSPCEKETYSLQQERTQFSFLYNMEYVLAREFGYVLPKEKDYNSKLLQPKNQRLHCVTRVSSYLPYGIYSTTVVQQITPRVSYPYKRISDSGSGEKVVAEIDQENNRNIKKFANSVIIHTDCNSREQYKFYDTKAYLAAAQEGQTFFSLPRQTIFANTNQETQSVPKETFNISLT